jgi:hypothetical protein
MDWYLWLIVGWWALNALLYVAYIGKVIHFTKGMAVFALFLYSALIAGLVVTR